MFQLLRYEKDVITPYHLLAPHCQYIEWYLAGQAGRLVAAGPAAPLVWLRAGPEAIEDYDVVVTNYDSSFNFTIRTYYLLDTVVHATAGSEQRSSPELDRTLDRYILT